MKYVAAIGITNQRETTVIWEKATGRPIYNALVWQDTRTAGLCAELAGQGGQDRFRQKTGLPLSTYFSGPKILWGRNSAPGCIAVGRRPSPAPLIGSIKKFIINYLSGLLTGAIISAIQRLLREKLCKHQLSFQKTSFR